MRLQDIPIPEVYKDESADFRFFLEWFINCLTKVQYDTENIPDLYDPLRCPSWLLWMLGDTMGFKYDDRLPVAFNRLVLLYFMSMIRNKGSKDGVTLAAEVNLAQFNILNYGKEKDILYDRLEDTSIPINSVFVNPHTPEGYIEVIYFSEKIPVDACIEYVRPLGMYCMQSAGVRFDARTKISIDPRLCSSPVDLNTSIGPTHVGHYSREDYSRMQKIGSNEVDALKQNADAVKYQDDNRYDEDLHHLGHDQIISTDHVRQPVYYRNSGPEGRSDPDKLDYNINPGWRALYSLQMCNNEHVVDSLIPNKIWGIGYGPNDKPEEIEVTLQDNEYLRDEQYIDKAWKYNWNLGYDHTEEFAAGVDVDHPDIYSDDMKYGVEGAEITRPHVIPAVNPIMSVVGDAISMNSKNSQYIVADVTREDSNHYELSSDDAIHIHKVNSRSEVSDDIVDNSSEVDRSTDADWTP